MGLKWSDVVDIAILLEENYPETNRTTNQTCSRRCFSKAFS